MQLCVNSEGNYFEGDRSWFPEFVKQKKLQAHSLSLSLSFFRTSYCERREDCASELQLQVKRELTVSLACCRWAGDINKMKYGVYVLCWTG
jgi:hypothetical protein